MLYAQWYGGDNYSYAVFPEGLETFANLDEAKTAMRERYEYGYSYLQTFHYVDKGTEYVYTPCVNKRSVMHLWRTDPRNLDPDYRGSDYVLTIGPRGGVQVKKYAAWAIS